MPKRPDQTQLRRRMGTTSDARAVRTRGKLVAAYQQLTELGHGRVTVADIVARSGVNRTTFYAHFDSIEALAVEAFADLAEVITTDQLRRRGQDGDPDPSLSSLIQAVHYAAERPELYLELLGHGTSAFFAAIEDAAAARTARLLRSTGALSDDRDVAVAARFIAAGTLGVVAEWLRGGMAEDPDRLAERLQLLLPPYLSRGARRRDPGPLPEPPAPGRDRPGR